MKLKYCRKSLVRLSASAAFVLFLASPCCAGEKVPVPEDAGLYLGAGVYSPIGGMLCGGFCFTYWEPGTLDPTGAVELCAKEGFCNTLQFWQRGEKLRDLCRLAKEKGIYSTCIYSTATNGLARALVDELGTFWIGYDFGERYNFALNDLGERGGTLESVAADEAARTLGYSHARIMFRHILPNVAHIILIQFSIRFPSAVSTEVFISFLGIGVQGEPSWGVMISNARLRLWQGVWWEMAFTTMAIFLLVLAFNHIADYLRDRLDPALRSER